MDFRAAIDPPSSSAALADCRTFHRDGNRRNAILARIECTPDRHLIERSYNGARLDCGKLRSMFSHILCALKREARES
jgi:hypothetical protein